MNSIHKAEGGVSTDTIVGVCVLCVRSATPHRALLVSTTSPANHLPTLGYSASGQNSVHVVVVSGALLDNSSISG